MEHAHHSHPPARHGAGGQHQHHGHAEPHHAHRQESGHDGHDKHAGHHTHDFLKRFWICTAVTIPVLLLSPMIQHWLGIDIDFPGDQYVLLGLSAFIYFYGGMPFLKGMVSEIRDKAIGMMTLVALAISSPTLSSA